MAKRQYLVIDDLRGGRNGADSPIAIGKTQCVEAMNVEFYEGMLGQKRRGAVEYSNTFAAGGTTPTGLISSLFYGTNTYGSVLFAVDNATVPIVNYIGLGSRWQKINEGDALAGSGHLVNAATFNNRVYVCYDSAVDRLHYWNYTSTSSDNAFYRVGLPAPTAAPTAANKGGGTQYGDTRYYKVAWITKSGSDIKNRSECSAVCTYDPATTAGPVTVTQPAVPTGENITHWEVYASNDDDIYHLITTVAIATTTYDDDNNPAAYDGDLPPVVGNNIPPKSWKFIATDGNRLFGAGAWEGGTQSRVWFTAVYGASDIGDSERVPLANYMDLDAYDSDAITGLSHFAGNVVVFKNRQIWRLVPTGDADAPYQAVCLTKAIGCVAPKSICLGEDASGNPALYFMSHRGPYRISTNGMEYCGRDIEDLTARMNQSATVVSHAVWYPAKHQVWFWLALDSDTYPSVRLIFDTHLGERTATGVRGGWAQHTGASCTAVCSVLYDSTPYPTGSHLVGVVPFIGSSVTNNLILRCDEPDTYTDNGTAYQSYITTRPYALGGLGFNASVSQLHLTAKATTGATVALTLTRDYGAETRSASVSLAPLGDETRVQRQFEGSELQGAGAVQFTLGDSRALDQSWTLDALMVPYMAHEER
jgi:hypothetical protein